MSDIIFTILAIICGVGAILFTGIFCAFAPAMQKQEGAKDGHESER